MYEEQEEHPIEAAHGLEAAPPIPTGQPTPPLAEDGGTKAGPLSSNGGRPDAEKGSVSAKKLEANRKNAQKSTGPRTEAGKAKAATNGYEHGFFAKHLFPTAAQAAKDKTDYLAVANGVYGHYQPVGYMENFWVEKIATEALRLARLVGYEQAQMMTWRYPFAGRASDSLLRYQTTTNRRLTDAIEQLEQLQQKRKAEAPLPEQHDPKPHGTDVESQEPPDESAPASEGQTGEHLREPRCDPQPPESCGTKPPVAAAEVGELAVSQAEEAAGCQQEPQRGAPPPSENDGTKPRKTLADLVEERLEDRV